MFAFAKQASDRFNSLAASILPLVFVGKHDSHAAVCDGCISKRGSDIVRRRQVAMAQFGEGVGRQDMGRQRGGLDCICQVCPKRKGMVSEGFGCGCRDSQGEHAIATREGAHHAPHET